MFYDRTAAIAAIVAAVVSTLSFIGLVYVAYAVQSGRHAAAQTAQDTSRPWLTPLSLELSRAPDQGDGSTRMTITLDYLNVGHEPAHGAAIAMRSGALEEELSSTGLNNVRSGENPTCNNLSAPANGQIIFPSSMVPRTFSQTDVIADEKSIENLKSIFVVQACIAYRVGNAVHHTKVCEFVEPVADKPIEQGRLRFCADGNEAD